jgi:hypothetical protein
MPWYKAGTVSVVQNSNAVIGTNTAFIANSRVGDAFRGPDGGWYEVTNIASDTAMSIAPNYQGATNSAGTYALAPMQGYVKDSADALRALVNQFGGVLGVLGDTPTQEGVRTALGLTNTDGLSEGATNLYFSASRAVASVLTGFVTSTGMSVVATDSVVVAAGKLQAQVSAALPKAGGTLTGPVNDAPAPVIPSAATVDIGAATSNVIAISGPTTITSFGAVAAGARRTLRFIGALQLTHNATSLILPGSASITTAVNDTAEFLSLGGGNWICLRYSPAAGLGTASSKNIGSSGDSVPLLSASNTWGSAQSFPSVTVSGVAALGIGSTVGATSIAPGAANFQVMSTQGRLLLTQGTGVNSIQSVNAANSGYLPLNVVCSNFYNDIDNGANLGNGSKRWATVFAVTGAINTSDAREKTPVSPMSGAEISASIALAKEIGSYKWLVSVDEKGDSARSHIGMTVQRAIEVMESYDLIPLDYAFICYDEWPAVEQLGHESIRGNIYSGGEKIFTDVEISEFEPYKEFSSYTWEETSRSYVVTQEAEPAGNRFGFRNDQLALFIVRGQEERLARIEARLDGQIT